MVRVATFADLERIAEISHARNGGEPAQVRARFERDVARTAHSGRRRLWVAEIDGLLAGFGGVHRFRPAPDAPRNVAPAGWYLSGVVVDPALRRRSAGSALTHARLEFIRERADHAYYVASSLNRASIDLHARFGFRQVARDFYFPRVTFTGAGVLFCAPLEDVSSARASTIG
jgi:ribosomal protein S18 acetylase RimI-like enzyme